MLVVTDENLDELDYQYWDQWEGVPQKTRKARCLAYVRRIEHRERRAREEEEERLEREDREWRENAQLAINLTALLGMVLVLSTCLYFSCCRTKKAKATTSVVLKGAVAEGRDGDSLGLGPGPHMT